MPQQLPALIQATPRRRPQFRSPIPERLFRFRRIVPVPVRPDKGLLAEPIAAAQRSSWEPLFMPEAVRKRFCGSARRKIDSKNTPYEHQRFVEPAASILLLRPDNHFQGFHTAWPQSRHSQRAQTVAKLGG